MTKQYPFVVIVSDASTASKYRAGHLLLTVGRAKSEQIHSHLSMPFALHDPPLSPRQWPKVQVATLWQRVVSWILLECIRCIFYFPWEHIPLRIALERRFPEATRELSSRISKAFVQCVYCFESRKSRVSLPVSQR